MKNILIPIAASLALAATGAWAKAPADATGECKDGTYTTSASKEGACSSHGGVKKWLAKEDKAADKKDKAAAKADEKGKAPTKADEKPKAASKADDKGKAASKADEKPKAAEKTTATASTAKPADATGECKDGTYTTSASKSGACAGHKGVKTWYETNSPKPDAKAAASAPAKSSTAATPAAAPSPAATSSAASSNASASSKATTPAAQREAAAGGGAGKVWVNTDSKVYHCEKDALYGKTKQGEYMTESQAKASGARPSRGKECA